MLISTSNTGITTVKFYAHDHLYSPVALLYATGSYVFERYEYDAYGDCRVLEANFAPDPDGKTDCNNFYLFTGRRVDILDNGSLKIQYNRNRYYDYYTGRWLTHDPLGINPAGGQLNAFLVRDQYRKTLALYEYTDSNPVVNSDPLGLDPVCCKIRQTITWWDEFGPWGVPSEESVTTCTQIDIDSECPPRAACCAEYKDKPNIEVYGAHRGKCCWCQVYRYIDPSGSLFPGSWHWGWAHQKVRVECEQGRGKWRAEVWPTKHYLIPHNVTPSVGSDLLATGSGIHAGQTSCDTADIWYTVLKNGTWWYQFPLHDCRSFAFATAQAMAASCP